MTLQTAAYSDGLADAAHAAVEAARAEALTDTYRARKRFLERTEDDARSALDLLVGEADAARIELVGHDDGWHAEIAGLPCRYDCDDDLTQEWRSGWCPLSRPCPTCRRDTAGPILRELVDLGAALEHEGPWPHDCQQPAAYHVSGWKQPGELAEWLENVNEQNPGAEVVTSAASVDGCRVLAVVKVPPYTIRADVEGF